MTYFKLPTIPKPDKRSVDSPNSENDCYSAAAVGEYIWTLIREAEEYCSDCRDEVQNLESLLESAKNDLEYYYSSLRKERERLERAKDRLREIREEVFAVQGEGTVDAVKRVYSELCRSRAAHDRMAIADGLRINKLEEENQSLRDILSKMDK